MNATRYDQGGSVLIIAVIAMLIFGILSFSFALLSRLEVTTAVNYKAQAQAEALAEAGLERGRDAVRTAADASGACGFSRWTDPGNSSSYGCDAGLAKLLFSGIPLGAGDYSVVIDNDCFPLVPVAIQDASCSGGTPGRDNNETAVLTAWATAANGLGRARVRAIVAIDTAWKHVCSNSSQDNPPATATSRGTETAIPRSYRRTQMSTPVDRAPTTCSQRRHSDVQRSTRSVHAEPRLQPQWSQGGDRGGERSSRTAMAAGRRTTVTSTAR